MKICKGCGIEKPADCFYKTRNKKGAEGIDSKCKECRKKRVKENRRKNIEYYREYDRLRGNRHGKGYLVKYRKNNPIKQQAHNRVNHAVIAGRITKPDECEECRSKQYKLHAHHDDYLRQLDVRWLCPACHHQWHSKFGEAANADHAPLPRGTFAA